MAICSWCEKEYDVSAVFHVCPDGTTFADRLKKSSEDIAKERERQDRLRSGYRAMREPIVPSSEAIVPAKDYLLPRQPNTVGTHFNWNHNDLREAKKMKIKI
jgi:hypothetical protein